ncbi:hypothetical protein Tco_0543281 [Tanacetum coccineum]
MRPDADTLLGNGLARSMPTSGALDRVAEKLNLPFFEVLFCLRYLALFETDVLKLIRPMRMLWNDLPISSTKENQLLLETSSKMPLKLRSALSIGREPVVHPEIRVEALEAVYLIALQGTSDDSFKKHSYSSCNGVPRFGLGRVDIYKFVQVVNNDPLVLQFVDTLFKGLIKTVSPTMFRTQRSLSFVRHQFFGIIRYRVSKASSERHAVEWTNIEYLSRSCPTLCSNTTKKPIKQKVELHTGFLKEYTTRIILLGLEEPSVCAA